MHEKSESVLTSPRRPIKISFKSTIPSHLWNKISALLLSQKMALSCHHGYVALPSREPWGKFSTMPDSKIFSRLHLMLSQT